MKKQLKISLLSVTATLTLASSLAIATSISTKNSQNNNNSIVTPKNPENAIYYDIWFKVDSPATQQIVGKQIVEIRKGNKFGSIKAPIAQSIYPDDEEFTGQWYYLDADGVTEITLENTTVIDENVVKTGNKLEVYAKFEQKTPTISLVGGSTSLKERTGTSGTDSSTWTLLRNGSKLTGTEYSLVDVPDDLKSVLSIKQVVGQDEGLVSWEKLPYVAENKTYSFKVKASVTSPSIEKTVDVSITIIADTYSITGGNSNITAYIGQSGSDTGAWQMKQNDTALPSDKVKYSLVQTGSDAPITSTFISLDSTTNKVTWTNVPGDFATESFRIKAVYDWDGDRTYGTGEPTLYSPITISAINPICSVEISAATAGDSLPTNMYVQEEFSFACEIESSVTGFDFEQYDKAWSAKVNGTTATGWIEADTGKLTVPSTASEGDKLTITCEVKTKDSSETVVGSDSITINIHTPTYDNPKAGSTGIYWKGTDSKWYEFTGINTDGKITFKIFGGNTVGDPIEPTEFNNEIYYGDNLTEVDTSFIEGGTSFNSPIHFPSKGGYSIGRDFLSGCTSFNQALNLTGCVIIDSGFMYDCTAYDQNLTLPFSIKYVGGDFMVGLNNFDQYVLTIECKSSVFNDTSAITLTCTNKTCDAYTNGFKVQGTYADDFKSLFEENKSGIIGSGTDDYYRVYNDSI